MSVFLKVPRVIRWAFSIFICDRLTISGPGVSKSVSKKKVKDLPAVHNVTDGLSQTWDPHVARLDHIDHILEHNNLNDMSITITLK